MVKETISKERETAEGTTREELRLLGGGAEKSSS